VPTPVLTITFQTSQIKLPYSYYLQPLTTTTFGTLVLHTSTLL